MRFKSKLSTEQSQLLFNIVTPVTKFQDNGSNNANHQWRGGSIFYLDREHFRISLRSEQDGVFCYIECMTEILFVEYKIESAADNAIMLELDLCHFREALQSVLSSSRTGSTARMSGLQPLYNSSVVAQQSQDDASSIPSVPQTRQSNHMAPTVVMKLAKKDGLPCLCFDSYGVGMEVHNSIPIKVMRTSEIHHYLPPKMSVPDVQLELPPGQLIRTVVDRLRLISNHILIEGTMTPEAGQMVLSVHGNGSFTQVHIPKLTPHFEDTKACTEDGTRPIEKATCTLKVDSKLLQSCLSWQSTLQSNQNLSVNSAIFCMVSQEMLVIHVLLQPRSLGFFTYYIPVLYLSPDHLN